MKSKSPSAPSPLPPRPLRLQMDHQSEEVRIELVPLIDVIFCILTFFILAAVGLSRQQAISVDLPKAGTGTSQMRELLIVSLDDFGQIFVEQQPVTTREQFEQALQNYRRINPDGMMVLYASRNASYNEVVQVLDILREVGGDRVGLATLPGSETAPQPAPGGVPPVPGSADLTPYPNYTPFDPAQPPFPVAPFDPTQPQIPAAPGQQLPGQPGIIPGSPLPPGSPGISPNIAPLPAPGGTATPSTNSPSGGTNSTP
ncbi:MAG: biopolymer transporter ExbD [Kastovskya adunca ATA6-11-RM4]|nr:biopolymer transporter ExbD [Kastovskya adunca ATA6-11-RM4]